MKIKATKVFLDLKEDVQRKIGEEFEVTEKRFKELSSRLPGYVSVAEGPTDDGEDNQQVDQDEDGNQTKEQEAQDDGEKQVEEEAGRKPRETRKPK